MVEHLHNDNLNSYFIESNNKVIVRFYSNWSGLCNAIEPFYHNLAQEQGSITFLDVDISHNLRTAVMAGAFSLPFIAVYEAGELKIKFSESNLPQLKEFLLKQVHTV